MRIGRFQSGGWGGGGGGFPFCCRCPVSLYVGSLVGLDAQTGLSRADLPFKTNSGGKVGWA